MKDLKNKIIQGDCLEKLKELEDNSVDAVVTDPPYGLGFMGKEWDTFDKSQFGKAGNEGENDLKVKKNFNILPRYNTDGLYDFTKNWAKECLRVLKPGGYLLSFAGTRTQHKIAMGIEDAGFEIRDMIMWCYGSGFPKSLNIGKAVDKLQGNEREEYLKPIAYPDSDCWGKPNSNSKGNDIGFETQGTGTRKDMDGKGNQIKTKGTSEWEGWGTALKPAWESITVAQKQLDTSGLSANVYNAESIFNGLRLKLETIHELFAEEPVISKAGRLDLRPNLSPIIMSRKPLSEKTVAENCLKWGVGGINIDGCRVGTEEMGGGTMPDLRDVGAMSKEAIGIDKLSCGQNPRPATRKEQPTYQGRFPANLIWSCNEDEYVIKSNISAEDILKIKEYYENKKS